MEDPCRVTPAKPAIINKCIIIFLSFILSAAMERIFSQIELVMPSQLTKLLSSEMPAIIVHKSAMQICKIKTKHKDFLTDLYH